MGDPIGDRIVYPEGESWNQMMQRVFGFMERIPARDVVIIVGHAGSCTAVIYWWLKLAPILWPDAQFEMDYGSISILTQADLGGRKIHRLNDVNHLVGLTRA